MPCGRIGRSSSASSRRRILSRGPRHSPKSANPSGREGSQMSIKGKSAIVGLGVTPMGKIYGRSSSDFAAEAIKLALDDAGLQKEEVDGLLINANLSPEMSPQLQMTLGLENLSLMNVMNAYGSTAGTMIQYASMAIQEGLANVVVLVYADAPLAPALSSGASYSGANRRQMVGMAGACPADRKHRGTSDHAIAATRPIPRLR